jgi:hypothetical protein
VQHREGTDAKEGMSLWKEGYVGSTNTVDVSQVLGTSCTIQGNEEVIS